MILLLVNKYKFENSSFVVQNLPTTFLLIRSLKKGCLTQMLLFDAGQGLSLE